MTDWEVIALPKGCCCPWLCKWPPSRRKPAAHHARTRHVSRRKDDARSMSVAAGAAVPRAQPSVARHDHLKAPADEDNFESLISVVPIILLDTIVPVSTDYWLWWLSDDADGMQDSLEINLAEDTSERPGCWDMPRPEKVLHEDHWPDARIDQMVEFFDDAEWLLREHLKIMRAYDLTIPNWKPMNCEPGSRVKIVTFMMPLPGDLPKSGQAILRLPEAVSVKTAYYYRRLPPRLPGHPAPVVLVWQSHSSGAPFCERYCIRGSIRFFPRSRGGLQVEAWSQVHWLKQTPWGLDWAKGVMDIIVKKEATEHLVDLVKVLGRGAGCINT